LDENNSREAFSSDMLIGLALAILGGLAWILASAAWWKGRWRTAYFVSALALLLFFLAQFFDLD
jgi:Mg/Co/Ni transporter MgtE